MNPLIFGKDQTERVVGVEPGESGECVLYVQGEKGRIAKKSAPMSHWILYSEQLSPKMKRLEGDQHYKWLIEYDSKAKYDDVLKASWRSKIDNYVARDPKEAFLLKSGVTMFKGLKAKDVSVLSFDLEHTYGIGDTLKRDGRILLISNTYRNSRGEIRRELFSYDDYISEGEMLDAWTTFIKAFDPSVIVGHNIFGHDFKILRHAAQKAGIKLQVGRDYSEMTFDRRPSFKRKDGSQAYEFFNAHIYGREIVDTFFLALTYDVGRKYESYGLKAIVKHEGLERADRVHYDASQIEEKYKDPVEWAKIKEYAEHDADDALALYDLMIPAFFYVTQSTPRSFQHVINSASGSQINGMMVRAYLQDGHSIAKASPSVEFEGAISFGIPGLHKNVLRFDVSSLYPSIIRQYRIFSREKDPKELFLKMVNYFTEERLKNKKIGKETGDRYYKDLEQSQKIMINSKYGFMGAPKLNYNYPEGAAAVTRYGREILKKAILWATGTEYQGDLEPVVTEEE